MARELGVLTPGLCIVADTLSAFEAQELAHKRPGIENIKVRPKSFVTNALGDIDVLRNGDFHVICDGKFYFSRVDELDDMLGLFAIRGFLPDAITYAPCVDEKIMSELVRKMLGQTAVPSELHTIILTGILPEQTNYSRDERLEMIKDRYELAHKLCQIGGKIAVYAAARDIIDTGNEVDTQSVMTIGAGISMTSKGAYVCLEEALEGGVDIPLIGSVMGETNDQRKQYLNSIAPLPT